MWEPSAQLERSSAGVGTDLDVSCLVETKPSLLMFSAAAAAYQERNSALAPCREKVASEIVVYADEWDQWDLPDETASANPNLLLFKTSVVISVSGVVEQMYQPLPLQASAWWSAMSFYQPPFPLHAPAWWGATSSSSIFGRWFDWPLNESSHFLLSTVCFVDWKMLTTDPQSSVLETLYQIEDLDAVAEFLAQNTFLYDLLIDAHGKIVEFFGDDADVHLELYDDPDFGGHRQMYAVIVTPLETKDAIPLQERLDETWWLDNLIRARGKFNIIVEYV